MRNSLFSLTPRVLFPEASTLTSLHPCFDRYCQTALHRGSTEGMSNVRGSSKEEEKEGKEIRAAGWGLSHKDSSLMRQRKQIQWRTHRGWSQTDEKTRTHSDSKGIGGESFHRETCHMMQSLQECEKEIWVPGVEGK